MDAARLRWRCRRGLLELDILLQVFLEQGYEKLESGDRALFQQLLETPDTELLSWLNGLSLPPQKELKEIVRKVIQVIDKNIK